MYSIFLSDNSGKKIRNPEYDIFLASTSPVLQVIAGRMFYNIFFDDYIFPFSDTYI